MKNQKNTQHQRRQNFLYTFSLFTLMLFINTNIFAQKNKTTDVIKKSITVKGTVYSEFDNLPLAGTAIAIKNTDRGTESDDNGNFEINNLKEGDTLTFYFTSFKNQEIKITKDMEFLKVFMAEDSTIMDTVFLGDVNANETFKTKRSFWKRIASIF